jgi:tRNA (guanine26-N2/guanine27-N2)-dimethyltransferase
MFKTIIEGKAKVKVPVEEKISRELPVFYNPVMTFNRDISVLLLKAVSDKHMSIGSPLAGTGVREIRMLLELNKDKIDSIAINDINPLAYDIIKENLALNNIKKFIEIQSEEDYNSKEKVKISKNDANKFLLNSSGFDYIDIDPFGTPNPFLNNAVARLARGGILAITATDTGCLAGTFPEPCMRKYWAVPSKDGCMHENGLRILIRKIQLIGADHDKALVPIFSYFKDHYFRVFLRCEKGKQRVDEIIRQHAMHNNAGPLWTGNLWDSNLVKRMIKLEKEEHILKFLNIILEESKIDAVGFHNLPLLCKEFKLISKQQKVLLVAIKKQGYKAARTHFQLDCIRSDIPKNELIKIMKN